MFEPLSADVTPQMTLFGTPAPSAASAADRRQVAPTTPRMGGAPIPSPSRIGRRRSSGGRGCATSVTGSSPRLTRRDGSTHREINAWINRKLGIASVEHATLDDLERSVELLVDKLSRRL